ncbi:MAG: hypothetical protein ACRDN9_03385 [Streptosporangiaceae bacterium]
MPRTLGLIKWEQTVFLGNPEYGVNMVAMDFVKAPTKARDHGRSREPRIGYASAISRAR